MISQQGGVAFEQAEVSHNIFKGTLQTLEHITINEPGCDQNINNCSNIPLIQKGVKLMYLAKLVVGTSDHLSIQMWYWVQLYPHLCTWAFKGSTSSGDIPPSRTKLGSSNNNIRIKLEYISPLSAHDYLQIPVQGIICAQVLIILRERILSPNPLMTS